MAPRAVNPSAHTVRVARTRLPVARRVLLTALLAGLAVGACSSAPQEPGTVVLTDSAISASPPDGATLHVRNEGQQQHQLVVASGGRVLAVTSLLPPGASDVILLPERGELELTSRYIAVNPDGTVQDDAGQGMFLRVDWPA